MGSRRAHYPTERKYTPIFKGILQRKRAQLLLAWDTGYDARTVDYGFRVVLGNQLRRGRVRAHRYGCSHH